ncbi:hypothetical protein EDD21DRAFT_387801 [Dissophora ornata]|nr:hypothetical protein EDD21DRAFT_387801 [Dissophora ornata]
MRARVFCASLQYVRASSEPFALRAFCKWTLARSNATCGERMLLHGENGLLSISIFRTFTRLLRLFLLTSGSSNTNLMFT